MSFKKDPSKRYVRSARTGDLGELTELGGKKFVIFPGRQGQEPIPYKENDWYDELEPRELTLLQCAEIAFAADQRLQYYLGQHARAKKTWLSLTAEDRIKFAEEGPRDSDERRLLWRVIMRATESLRGKAA